MVELSTEQKAKAYDEAKLRMSAAYNSNRCTIGFMNEIFPELEESEDEKIKKSINRLIRYYHDVNFPTPEGFNRKDLLDWVEKQGEQESANWLQELEDKLANATPKQLAEWKEKYFKEEPAEWSEEDEDKIKEIKNALYKQYGEDKAEDLYYYFLEPILYKVQPQLKQEWSEEDEDILNTIINHFKIDIECTDEDDVIRWLKSLRPNYWKPSEEQLNALHWCVMNVGSTEHQVLQELLEQLEKLKD